MIRSTAETTFTNEAGKKAFIGVADSDEHPGAVEITLIGPQGTWGADLTLNEVYALYETIGKYLDEHQKNTPGN